MALIAVLVFVGAFAMVAALLLVSSGSKQAEERKQAIATLNSAIAAEPREATVSPSNFQKNQRISAIPWLNRKLEKLEIGPKLTKLLNQADLRWTPGKLMLMSLAIFCATGYLVYLRIDSALFGLLIGFVLSLGPIGYVLVKRSRRFGKFEQALPDALDLMVSALRVGHSFNAAMGLVTRECPDPVSTEFRVAFDEQNFGLELRIALEHLTERIPLQDLKMAVTAILIQRESGGNLAEVLEKTAHVIRERFRLKKQVMVHTAQGRLTGWVLTILPIALGIGLYLLNPDSMSLLWKRDIGLKMMYAAGGMIVIGTILIQKIVRMDV